MERMLSRVVMQQRASLRGAAVAGARGLSASAPEKERAMEKTLRDGLQATQVTIKDISGGCGSFYEVVVASPKFAGLSRVKQNQMVQQLLQAEISTMHGINIRTSVSPS